MKTCKKCGATNNSVNLICQYPIGRNVCCGGELFEESPLPNTIPRKSKTITRIHKVIYAKGKLGKEVPKSCKRVFDHNVFIKGMHKNWIEYYNSIIDMVHYYNTHPKERKVLLNRR